MCLQVILENYVINNRAKMNFNLARHMKSSREIVSNITENLIESSIQIKQCNSLDKSSDIFAFNIKQMQRGGIV